MEFLRLQSHVDKVFQLIVNRCFTNGMRKSSLIVAGYPLMSAVLL